MKEKTIRVLHVTRLPITVATFLLRLLREHRVGDEAVRVACNDGPPRRTGSRLRSIVADEYVPCA